MKFYKIESRQTKHCDSMGLPMSIVGASVVYINLEAVCAMEVNDDGSASLRMMDRGQPIDLSADAAAKFVKEALEVPAPRDAS